MEIAHFCLVFCFAPDDVRRLTHFSFYTRLIMFILLSSGFYFGYISIYLLSFPLLVDIHYVNVPLLVHTYINIKYIKVPNINIHETEDGYITYSLR